MGTKYLKSLLFDVKQLKTVTPPSLYNMLKTEYKAKLANFINNYQTNETDSKIVKQIETILTK